MIKFCYSLSLVLFVSILITSCNKSVNLLLKNETGQDAVIKVGTGNTKEDAGFRDFDTKHLDTVRFKTSVKDGSKLFIYAELNKGGKTRTTELIADQDIQQNISLKASISPSPGPESIDTTVNELSEFGNPSSYYLDRAQNAKNVCKTLLGGFRIYNNDKFIYPIYPVTLGTDSVSFDYGIRNKKILTVYSKNYSAQIKASLPFISNLDAHFGMSEFVKFYWNIKNAGPFEWIPKNKKSISQLFFGLDEDELNTILDIYEKDSSTITMRFYYKAFVIKKLEIKSYKFNKMSSGIDISASMKLYAGLTGNYQESDSITYEDNWDDAITQLVYFDATWMLKQASLKRQQKKLVTEKTQIALNSQASNKFNFLAPPNSTATMKEKIKELESQLSAINSTLKAVKEDSTYKEISPLKVFSEQQEK